MPKKKKDGTRKTKAEYTKTDWAEWLWPTFSRYIRIRDCFATTGTTTYGICCTCGRRYSLGKLQAGHFIPGRMDAILFDEEQVHAQCYRCNMLLQGVWPVYYEYMVEKVGLETVHEMLKHRNDSVEFLPEWFEQTKKYYEWSITQMLAVA